MRLLSWNLWNSFKRIENPFLVSFLEPVRRREKRYLHQLKLLHDKAIDVCLLQEVNPVFDKIRDFKDILKYHVTYQIDQGGLRFKRVGLPLNFTNGLVTLTKDSQKKVRGLKLSGTFGASEDDYSLQFSEFRYANFSEILRNDKKILLVNTHFHHGIEWSESLESKLKTISTEDLRLIKSSVDISTKRKEQEIEILIKEVQRLQSEYDYVIVAGDFNFSHDAKIFDQFVNAGLKRVEYKGNSWDPEVNHDNFRFSNALRPPVAPEVSDEALQVLRHYDGRSRAIDHFFITDSLAVKSVQVFGQVANKDGYFPSDHFGIEVDIDL